MSRTTRRNESWLIRAECTTLEVVRREGHWYNCHHPELTPEQSFIRHVAHFTSDCYFGLRGSSPPRDYLDHQFNRPHRRATRRELDRCLRTACWDNHLTPAYVRKQNLHWW